MLTNKTNMPQALFSAILNDTYQGYGDISTTRAIGPPRIYQLELRHKDEIVEDATERFYSLLGQAVHAILERITTPDCIMETRLTKEVLGWTVSGQIDLFELITHKLFDYKVTSLWSLMGAPKDDYVNQCNFNAVLLRNRGLRVAKAEIYAIYRDWSLLKSKQGGDYPRHGGGGKPISLWDEAYAELYVKERVRMHQIAGELADDKLPECTPEERWEKPTTYAVMRQGRKSAVRVLDTNEDALSYMKKKDLSAEQHYIQERPGESTRCIHYCRCAPFCNQYKEMNHGK